MKKLITIVIIIGVIVIFAFQTKTEDALTPIKINSVVYGLPGDPPSVDFTEIDSESLGTTTFRPSEFSTTLAEGKNEGHSDTTLKVNSITTKDDNTLDPAVLGDLIVLHINPGRTNAEIVICTGLTTATKTFTSCTFGYRFDKNTTQAANIKAHAPGETVIISNDDHYLNVQYAAIDQATTITGQYTFATSTNNTVKLYFTTSTEEYIWANKATGQIGFASSSAEFAFNTGGTTFSTLNPLQLNSGVLVLATSSVSGLTLNGSSLEVHDGYGLQIDSVSGQLELASSTDLYLGSASTTKLVVGSTNPSGFSLATGDLYVGGSATTTSLSVTTLCFSNSCSTGVTHKATTTAAAVTLDNVSGTTTIASFTVPANKLGTTNAIKAMIPITDFQLGSDPQLCIDLNYGSTQVATQCTTNGATTAASMTGMLEVWLIANNSTSAQRGGWVLTAIQQDTHSDTGAIDNAGYSAVGSATENSATDLTFSIEASWATANAGNQITFDGIIIEYVR